MHTVQLLHALGKTVDGSGLDVCTIEAGIYTSASLRRIFGGKAYKRGIEFHITLFLAVVMMKLDAIDGLANDGIIAKCSALREALHDRSPNVMEIYEEVSTWHSQHLLSSDPHSSEMAKFLDQYLEQINSLLHLIHACRSADWEAFLAALQNNIRFFFARDLLNYARMMPVYLRQMTSLEQDDPTSWQALKEGAFVVAKSGVPFTPLFTDQALEQEIKVLKKHGGIVGLSQDERALDRLVTITPQLAHMVEQYLHGFPGHGTSPESECHYQLVGDVAVRIHANAKKIAQSIEIHCEGNPYKTETPLRNLASSAVIAKDMKDDILEFPSKGQKAFEDFVEDRLKPSSKSSICQPIKKLKLKTWNEKARIQSGKGDKVIKLKEERELLGRFLIIQASRPELVPKLEETIGNFEMSVVPRALCAVDGSLYIPADKSSLMHAIEGTTGSPVTTEQVDSLSQTRVLVIDAMAVLQGLKKIASMKTLADLVHAFTNRIRRLMQGYNECRVVFDRYLEQSLKDKTRTKRATTSVEYDIHHDMRLTMTLKDLLSSSATKAKLTTMFAESLLEDFTSFNLVVVYGTTIKSHEFEAEHCHEEADTLIPNQVLDCLNDQVKEICVLSPDTDVLTLLVDLTAHGRLPANVGLKFLTGKGAKYREINVARQVGVIGNEKCKGLIGLHHFSGADWGGKFVGITKKRWVEAYMKLPNDDPAIKCFQDLGIDQIPQQLNGEDLPLQVKALETFVCQVYSSSGLTAIPALRWELFRSKNLEGEMLPPTRAALLPHLMRANYMAMRDKTYPTRCPNLPPVEQNGWEVKDGMYIPVRCLNSPAPRAVIELTKCGCKSDCSGARCSCFKNALPCTPLCKCYNGVCDNQTRDEHDIEDDDDDNE